MDAERLERAARDAATMAYDMGQEDERGSNLNLPRSVIRTMHIDRAVAAALDAAPEPAQAGEAVAWQVVDHNYGPTHYFGMTEDDAWARMVKASGEGRSVWARTRFARPLYAAPAPAQADPWAWAVLLPGNTPQQARIRMTEREAMSCAAELPGFVIVPLYAAPSRPGGAS